MLGNEFKAIEYRFERNFLNKVGRVSSNLLEVVQIIDHTTTRGSPKRSMSLRGSLVVAAKQEPAVGGEMPSISDGVAGLELPKGTIVSGATTRFPRKAPMHKFH